MIISFFVYVICEIGACPILQEIMRNVTTDNDFLQLKQNFFISPYFSQFHVIEVFSTGVPSLCASKANQHLLSHSLRYSSK